MTAWFEPFDTCTLGTTCVHVPWTWTMEEGMLHRVRCTNTIYPYSVSMCLFSAATFPPIYQYLPSAVLYLRVVI